MPIGGFICLVVCKCLAKNSIKYIDLYGYTIVILLIRHAGKTINIFGIKTLILADSVAITYSLLNSMTKS